MADYESFPLWRRATQGTSNIDPALLPITTELAGSLLRWADDYDLTLNRDDPLASGFPGPESESDFYARGEALARRLARELGDAFVVTYFDGRTGLDTPITA
ncbi:hypothetical protein [Paractinoplanes rishiriensis]|nr:hypothetical protein [Actinoplanes rishiriensis]